MQQFRVTLLVTANTIATVSESEVLESVKGYIEDSDSNEGWEGGNIEVTEIEEI